MSTFDHELNIDGIAYQFEIIRREDDSAMYSVPQYVPEHQAQLKVYQKDWIGGHGKFNLADSSFHDEYFEGQSIDTTQEGRIFLGPLIHEVKESDDSDLDSAPVCFMRFGTTGEWLCATSGTIYRYIKVDTTIDTDEGLTATETDVTCDANASTPIPVGSIIHVEDEQMEVTATGTILTVIRSVNGTTAATHTTDKDIYISKWTAATDTVANATQMVEYNGVAYAACSAGNEYFYSTDGDNWTESTLSAAATDKFAEGFFTAPNAAGTANVLWKFIAPNKLFSSTDGTNSTGSWGSVAYIGDSSGNIISIFLIGDKLMIGKEDNLYWYDSDGGVHPQFDALKITKNANNFKYVVEWQGSTYFSLGTGIGEISGGYQYDRMGPLHKIGDIGKSGTCVGLSGDEDYLYVTMDEGTNTIIYKGREVRKEGWLRWEWCPWVFLSTTATATVKVCQHSSTDKRLWSGYGSNTAYVIITDNPTADSSARFCASGWLRMSYLTGTNPYWDKMFQSVITQTKACTANLTVTPKYRKNAETSATNLTTAITTNGTVKTNLTTAITSKQIQFELHLATNSSSTTPEVSYFEVRGTEKPETVRVHEVTYKIGDKPSQRAKTRRALFRTAKNSTTMIKFADLRYGQKTSGTSSEDYVWCVMEAGFPLEQEIIHTRGRSPELGITVRLREISYTIS